MRAFYSQRGHSNADVHALWCKKLWMFWNFWCIRTDKRGGNQFSWFSADIFYRRPLMEDVCNRPKLWFSFLRKVQQPINYNYFFKRSFFFWDCIACFVSLYCAFCFVFIAHFVSSLLRSYSTSRPLLSKGRYSETTTYLSFIGKCNTFHVCFTRKSEVC